MELAIDDKTAIRNRLKRAAGQINGVLRMLDDDADCTAIITQLSACSKAIDRAGFTILLCGVESCANDSSDTQTKEERIKVLEKLFLSLA